MLNREFIKQEVLVQYNYKETPKDIILVAHNQHQQVYSIVKAIYDNVKNFKLYIFDNASYPPLQLEDDDIELVRSDTNDGYVSTTNYIISISSNPYAIVLSSEVELYKSWDTALIAHLQQFPDMSLIGYYGAKLDDRLNPFNVGKYGFEQDCLINGCLCIRREDYKKYGLFDDSIQYTYFEDVDLSLRMAEVGKLYSLRMDLVRYEYDLIVGNDEMKNIFESNNTYMMKKHAGKILSDNQEFLRKDAQ